MTKNITNIEELKEKKIKERIEELADEVWARGSWESIRHSYEVEKETNVWTVLKHDAAMGKLLDRIDLLENNLSGNKLKRLFSQQRITRFTKKAKRKQITKTQAINK